MNSICNELYTDQIALFSRRWKLLVFSNDGENSSRICRYSRMTLSSIATWKYSKSSLCAALASS